MHSYIVRTKLADFKVTEEEGYVIELGLPERDESLPVVTDTLVAKELKAYTEGKLKEFSQPLKYNGTQFQMDVWNYLSCIPYGDTVTYEDVAIAINRPKAVRAVGNAVGKNPIAIIIPCHRVVRKDGSLGGFGLGVDLKEKLLDGELHGSE